MSILIVDDDPTIRELSTLLLMQAGFSDVITSESGQAALQLLGIEPAGEHKVKPDVILMDIMMPGIDGIETCARIKQHPDFADIPVVMVTSLGDIEHLKKAFIAGAADYMTKPIRSEELMARTRSAHRLRQELQRRKQREAEILEFMQQRDKANCDITFDAVTGLTNENHLLEVLQFALERTPQRGSLTLLAPDAAAAYRDRYGEEKFSALMQHIAEYLSQQSSHLGDVIFRLDSTRLAVFHPILSGTEATLNADNWRKGIAALKIPHGFTPIGPLVTVSSVTFSINSWHGGRADLLAEASSLLERVQTSKGNQSLQYQTPRD